jgi:osmotically-inducible protein OsmY
MTRNQLMSIVATAVLMTSGSLAHAQDAEKPADAAITAQVKERLATNDPIIAPRIAVSTQDGVVTLKGIALTQQYILNAMHDARSVDGVVKVENQLRLE